MGRDDHAFDGAVRVFLHENAVFERPGLGFVGIAHDVLGLARRLCRSFPLDAGWKCRAAAADQARSLHLREHVLRRHRQSLFQSGITAAAAVIGKGSGMTLTAIAGKDADIAADEADRSLAAARADRRRALRDRHVQERLRRQAAPARDRTSRGRERARR